MDKKWDWQEQFSSDKAIAIFRCIGFTMQEKGRFCTFRLHDIPSEGRRNLAYKLRLNEYNFEEWAVLEKVETYRDQYYFTVSVEKAWFKSKTEDWNWKKKSGSYQETAEYGCPGWKCSKEILRKLHNSQLSIFDIPSAARNSLAATVGLDKDEINAWSSKFKAWTDEEGIHVSLHVPNTWITANILAFAWDPISSAAAVGGIIGAAATSGYVQVISGMKEIRCDTFQSLLLALDHYKGRIWGFTLFAHGSKSGVITDKCRDGIMNWQDELLNKVQQNNYKLGHINLMQCFSGYKGKATLGEKALDALLDLQCNDFLRDAKSAEYNSEQKYLDEMKEKILSFIKIQLTSQPYIEVINLSGAWYYGYTLRFTYCADIKLNWEAKWKTQCLELSSYQSMNVCLIDVDLPDNLLELINSFIKTYIKTLKKNYRN